MSSNVKVSGIPTQLKLGRLIPLFSNILSMRSSDFLLRILPSNGPTKDVLISLATYSEAQLAQEKLDNFIYKHNNVTYIFASRVDFGYNQNNRKSMPRTRFQKPNARHSYGHLYERQQEKGQHRDRSRSPLYGNTSSQLDMQIEILKKQRMILEEERKLLEEQKKLDQLKMNSFNNETSSVAYRNYEEDVEMFGPSEKKFEPKQLTFYQASGVLMRKMNMFIHKHSSPEKRKALLTHLRSILKQRLAAVVAADGQGIYQTHKVIMLYRSQYPTSEDEELVKEALKDIQEDSCTNNTETVKSSTKGASAKNKPDGNKNAADKHSQQEKKATTKDKTLSDDSKDIENSKKTTSEKPEKKFEEKRLFFYKSSGALIRKMNSLMDKHSPPEKRKLLVEYLRFTLRQRLATIIARQPIYQTHKIVKLYRSQHPPAEDEGLIKQLLKDIDEGRVPEDVMNKDKEVNLEKEIKEEQNTEIDNTTPQDKSLSGEETTDYSGQLRIKEGIDVSANTNNESNNESKVKENIDDKAEILENKSNLEDNAETVPGNSSEVKKSIKEVVNDNVGVANDTEKEIVESNKCDNSNADTDIKQNVVVETLSDNVKIEVKEENLKIEIKENHGIKRKNDDVEEIASKVAKTDCVAVIGSNDTN